MNDTQTVRLPDIQQVLRQNRWVFLAEGVLLLLGGVFSILSPGFAGDLLAVAFGILSITIGVFLFVRAMAVGGEDRVSTLITGVLFGIIGVVLLFWPEKGLEGLTLLLAMFCLLRGIMDLTGQPSRSTSRRGLQIMSGAAGVVLGVLLFVWWPSDSAWAIGSIFGIMLIFMAMIVLALWNGLNHPDVHGPSGAD